MPHARLIFILALLPVQFLFADVGTYKWVKVEASDIKQILHLTGKVVPQDGALSIATARTQGRIVNFLRKEGEAVGEGTPIYTISSGECLSLEEEKRVAALRQIADLLVAVKRREKQLGLQLSGQDCKVISNSKGVIIKRNLEIGASFNPGDALATIVDTSRLTVELEVPEGDILKVKPQDLVSVHFSGFDDAVTGRVGVIVPSIDALTRTNKIRIKNIKINSKVSIDSMVTADLELLNKNEKAFKVPLRALVFSKNQSFVVKKVNQESVPVAVKVLSEVDDMAVVRPIKANELKETDEVISEGAIFNFNERRARE